MTWAFIGVVLLFVGYHMKQWVKLRKHPTIPHVIESPTSDAPAVDELVSFLVPVWNGASAIEPFVESYRSLRLPRKELVLCAGGQDGSLKEAARFQREDIIVLEQPPGGKQRALRTSLPVSRGAIIFLTDIDCVLTNDAVEDTIRTLRQGGCGAATGSSCPLEHDLPNPFIRVQWAVERYVNQGTPDYVGGLLGRNAAVWRSVIEETGVFDKEVFSGTDYTMAKELLLAGYRIRYANNSEMPTEYPDSFKVYVRKQTRWVRNVIVLGTKYGAWAEVRNATVTLLWPLAILAFVIIGCFIPFILGLAILLFLHPMLNRARYAHSAGVQVARRAVFLSAVADMAVSGVTVYQLLLRKYTW